MFVGTQQGNGSVFVPNAASGAAGVLLDYGGLYASAVLADTKGVKGVKGTKGTKSAVLADTKGVKGVNGINGAKGANGVHILWKWNIVSLFERRALG